MSEELRNTYTDRELDAKFEAIAQVSNDNRILLTDKILEVHNLAVEIKQQTTKTNGNVSQLQNYRWFLTGSVAVLTVLVVPILIYVIESILK